MDLLITLVDPPADLVSATVELRVDDQSQAGAPARNLQKHRIGPVAPDAAGRLHLALPALPPAGTADRPALNLRVHAVTASGTSLAFVNTGEILLPDSDAGVVRADVFRI